MAFKKLTQQQRARIKAGRADARKLFRNRLAAEAVAVCFSYVAWIDGKPTRERLLVLGEHLAEWRTDAREQSIQHVTREDLARKVRSFLSGGSPTITERRRLVRALSLFVKNDREFSALAEGALTTIADLLLVSPQKRGTTGRGWGARAKTAQRGTTDARSGRNSKQPAEQPAPLHWSYEYLGCSASDSDEVIKRAYRQLAVKLHPDKHAAKARSLEDATAHIRAFQKLQDAYEQVLKLRGKG